MAVQRSIYVSPEQLSSNGCYPGDTGALAKLSGGFNPENLFPKINSINPTVHKSYQLGK
jgi:hypothetical protein